MRIAFLCTSLMTGYVWTADSINEGIGGSEEAAIHMAEFLGRRGHQVSINMPGAPGRKYGSVTYDDYSSLAGQTVDVAVAWRVPKLAAFPSDWGFPANFNFRARRSYLWLHEDLAPDLVLRDAHMYDKVIVLSNAHRQFYSQLPDSRVLVSSNGINPAQFDGDDDERDPFLIVYGSNYDRGLGTLLTRWPKIKEQVPQCRLNVFYGWQTIESLRPEEAKALHRELDPLLRQPGVTHLGRISNKEVAAQYMRAGVWAYPCRCYETSCISAMKAQAAGAVPVVIPTGALRDVVRFGFRTDRGYDQVHSRDAGELETQWFNGLIALLRSPAEQTRIRRAMIPASKARFAWSAVVDQWEREFTESMPGPGNHIAAAVAGAAREDPQTFEHGRDLLPAEDERTPEDAHSVLRRAQHYFDKGDFVNARKWYARRIEMGGDDEEVYVARYQIAVTMMELGAPWPDVQDALLKTWEFRPTRAEPLYTIALRYRAEQRYQLGYQFAKLAAEIPVPEQDEFARADIPWRATEEQAICAYSIAKHAEAFTLFGRLLARPDVPDADRQRIAGNRDALVPTMVEAASSYPDELVQRLLTGSGQAEVLVSLVAGPDRDSTEHTLNSFLNCCTDVSRVGRFLVVDAGLSSRDRAILSERYGFLNFADPGVLEEARGPGADLAEIRGQVDARWWLHLDQGWRFFARENFITRLTAVLAAEPQVFQVGINLADAVGPTSASAVEGMVRRAPGTGRYVLAEAVASGPAMFDTARLDRAGGVQRTDPDPLAELGRRAAAAGLRTASLDEVLCIA